MLTGNPFKWSTDLELLLSTVGILVGHNSEEKVITYWENRVRDKTITECCSLCLTQIEVRSGVITIFL